MRKTWQVLSKSMIAVFLLGTAITASAAHPPFPWQILPGEDIAETARLIYPKDAMARENLVRAIIRINPDHFPQGANRQLAAGTVIQFPDLRTIGAYAKKVTAKQPKRNSAIDSKQLKLMESIAQLENTALAESQQLATLTQHIATLESLLREWRPPAAPSVPVTVDPAPQSSGDETQPGDVLPIADDATDLPVLAGALFALLIGLITLCSFRVIRQRFNRQPIAATDAGQRETLLVLHRESESGEAARIPESTGQVMAEVNTLIEQNNGAAAIELLQKQLAVNQSDINGWLQLFELLYQAGNKRDFKKNARRFKRMKVFPDIWLQIQELGSRLEPNESLYFSERQRKEKFFPESVDFS